MEYYTTVFEIYSDDIDKTHDLTKELPYFNIKLELPKFRISGSHYSCDVNNKTIYKNIQSIKYLNETIAEQLYAMRDTQFNSFIDFLKVNPCNSAQTEILIKLDFFSEFGKSDKLICIYSLFTDMYTKKDGQIVPKKMINKEKTVYPHDILRKYSKETDTRFNVYDMDGFCTEIISTFEDKDLPITERLEAQTDYLSYIEYVNPAAKTYGYILSIDIKYAPKFQIYKLDTGETITVKYGKREYEMSGLKEKQVIRFVTYDKPKRKLVDGHWVESDETEPWIKAYKIPNIS